ncbi:MAG: carbon-nitrogen family hydrolase [Bacillota bacterium]
MKVALIQMDIALGQPERNRERGAALVREAAARGARLILLPEMWTTGYCLPDLAGRHADQSGEPTGSLLAGLARETGAYIAGSVADERGGRVYNRATLYTPSGERVAAYDKIHLVPMMDEHRYLTPGDRLATAELDGAKAGLAICYDLRFPELFRSLTLAGVELFLIPAEWPAQRLHHWRTLAMARAIENQAFVLACNRVGEDGANRFPGHSLVIDPFGTALAEGGEGEEILLAEIDLSQVAAVRERIPALRDRRPDLYELR